VEFAFFSGVTIVLRPCPFPSPTTPFISPLHLAQPPSPALGSSLPPCRCPTAAPSPCARRLTPSAPAPSGGALTPCSGSMRRRDERRGGGQLDAAEIPAEAPSSAIASSSAPSTCPRRARGRSSAGLPLQWWRCGGSLRICAVGPQLSRVADPQLLPCDGPRAASVEASSSGRGGRAGADGGFGFGSFEELRWRRGSSGFRARARLRESLGAEACGGTGAG
jgi:hypothetical protein